MDKVEVEENDIVIAMSDGVVDNLWEHEVLENVLNSIRKWESGELEENTKDRAPGAASGMLYVADQLMKAARLVAEDPYAESPFMERAVEEGLAMEGGLLAHSFLRELLLTSSQVSWTILVSLLRYVGDEKVEELSKSPLNPVEPQTISIPLSALSTDQ